MTSTRSSPDWDSDTPSSLPVVFSRDRSTDPSLASYQREMRRMPAEVVFTAYQSGSEETRSA